MSIVHFAYRNTHTQTHLFLLTKQPTHAHDSSKLTPARSSRHNPLKVMSQTCVLPVLVRVHCPEAVYRQWFVVLDGNVLFLNSLEFCHIDNRSEGDFIPQGSLRSPICSIVFRFLHGQKKKSAMLFSKTTA